MLKSLKTDWNFFTVFCHSIICLPTKFIHLNPQKIKFFFVLLKAMTHLYKVALGWLCKAKTVTDNMEAVWTAVLSIKGEILNLLETDNDGMRTHAIKFMEMLVITQTHSEGENTGKDLCLDDVPLTLKIARPRKLEEEAMQVK